MYVYQVTPSLCLLGCLTYDIESERTFAILGKTKNLNVVSKT